MMGLVRRVKYLVIIKWKKGEYTALRSASAWDQEDIMPLVVVPPAGDVDPDEGRSLEPTEHIKRFGPALFASWGQRPVFVDAKFVDDDQHRLGFNVHPLTSLLGRAHLCGAQACPATGLDRTDEYQSVVARFAVNNPNLPICLRLSAMEFEGEQLSDQLEQLLTRLGCGPERVVMVVDLAGAALPASDEFVDSLIDRLNHLPLLHKWLNLALAMTSFPHAIKAKAGECTRYPRTDWEIYRRLVGVRERVIRMPIFSDYALEYPEYRPVGIVTPRARLRYSTVPEYVIDSGTTVKKPFGYQAIFEVARSLVARSDFAGEAFSDGNAYIAALAKESSGPGQAWQWRWATTEHHLRLVIMQIRQLFGLPPIGLPAVPEAAEQADLFHPA